MNFINYCLLTVAGWFLIGLIAKGIIRGNNIELLRQADLRNRKTKMSVYWALRWERTAFLLGPIGLYQVVYRSVRTDNTSFSLFQFSLRPHGLGVRLAFTPAHYDGRLIDTKFDTTVVALTVTGTLFLIGCGVWLINLSLNTRDPSFLAMGLGFVVMAIAAALMVRSTCRRSLHET